MLKGSTITHQMIIREQRISTLKQYIAEKEDQISVLRHEIDVLRGENNG